MWSQEMPQEARAMLRPGGAHHGSPGAPVLRVLTQPSSSQTCIQGSGSTPIFLGGTVLGQSKLPAPSHLL